jgi:alkanesulfonate monooxygenase SsuD/methylene tetrahydromethanopterin reductase-like flavin-dependent oxidoreductase (luciferase family)
MEFGLFMMPLHPPYRSYADSYDRDLALLVEADRLGFHEAWIGEHLTERWENAPCPDLLIAKASAMTQQIKLATGITLLPIHNPVELAHRIAMLDHLTRGRFYWGIGHRAIPTDLALFGLDPKQGDAVREQAAEVLDIVLKIWANEGPFRYHGKYFTIEAPELDAVLERGLHMKPYQQPHPPIGVAATSRGSSSIRVAGERGWIPMSSSNLAPQYLGEHWTLVEDAAVQAGQTMDRSQWRIGRDVFIAKTSKEARERARAVLGRNYTEHQRPNRLGSGLIQATKIDPNMSDDDLTVDYMLEHIWIVGDPEECAERIRALYDQVGGFGHLLAITQDPDDPEWEMECLQLLMQEVGPRVADLTGKASSQVAG